MYHKYILIKREEGVGKLHIQNDKLFSANKQTKQSVNLGMCLWYPE